MPQVHEHFQPETILSLQEQRKLRSNLEQIDVATFEANKSVLSKSVGKLDLTSFKKLATSAAIARAHWVAAAVALSEPSHTPSEEEVEHLAKLRATYRELAEAYEAMRRVVERGYVVL